MIQIEHLVLLTSKHWPWGSFPRKSRVQPSRHNGLKSTDVNTGLPHSGRSSSIKPRPSSSTYRRTNRPNDFHFPSQCRSVSHMSSIPIFLQEKKLKRGSPKSRKCLKLVNLLDLTNRQRSAQPSGEGAIPTIAIAHAA